LSTRRKAARRCIGLAAACVTLLNVAACGSDGGRGAEDAGAEWVPPTATAPVTTAPARLKKVTSACNLLPAAAVVKLLGGSLQTKLTAKEEPVEEKADGDRRYQCIYGRDGQETFALLVSAAPDQADTAAESIDAIAEASKAKTTRVDGLGAGGVGYAADGVRVLAVAVPYEAELRLVVFTGPTIVPHSKFVETAEHVVAQL